MSLKPRRIFSPGVEADGAVRRGRVFTLRLESTDEDELRKLYTAYELEAWEHPWPGPRSLGAFIVWAARKWKPLNAAAAAKGKARARAR